MTSVLTPNYKQTVHARKLTLWYERGETKCKLGKGKMRKLEPALYLLLFCLL